MKKLALAAVSRLIHLNVVSNGKKKTTIVSQWWLPSSDESDLCHLEKMVELGLPINQNHVNTLSRNIMTFYFLKACATAKSMEHAYRLSD